ncbi:hypothetical protein BC941DRAFT_515782 [Chlamydoabsidia padenii]|nr:hypothetical protein BC941DRAFT_515782 [Chlamydoabsidia padenii]
MPQLNKNSMRDAFSWFSQAKQTNKSSPEGKKKKLLSLAKQSNPPRRKWFGQKVSPQKKKKESVGRRFSLGSNQKKKELVGRRFSLGSNQPQKKKNKVGRRFSLGSNHASQPPLKSQVRHWFGPKKERRAPISPITAILSHLARTMTFVKEASLV